MMDIRIRWKYLALLPLLLFPSLAIPSGSSAYQTGSGESFCGTSRQRQLNAIAKDRYLESRTRLLERLGRRPLSQVEKPSAASDTGDVAVIEDDGTVISDVNQFDLGSRSFRFEPAGAGSYRAVASDSSYDSTTGTTLALKDDDTAEVQLGFPLTFYGKTYTRVELNSDGNLTFVQGDAASTDRDLARFVSGPPRIAPFFADLNPQAGGKISYRSMADGMMFTWDAVPDFDSTLNRNSFNVRLFTNGNIEFSYGTIVSPAAVVGIAPGGSIGAINAVDFTAGLPTSSLSGALVEVFSNSTLFSEAALSRLFFKTHPDDFDQLVAFFAFSLTPVQGAFAYEMNIKNEIEGLGLELNDDTQTYGSNGRLRSFVMMGSLDGPTRFPTDPTANFFRTYNTLQVVAHEVAHRWLAHPRFGANQTLDLIHTSDKAHWSFFLNADASVMEGNKLEDRGADKGDLRFMTTEATNKYSALDKYLMGYARKEDVPPMFFVQNPTGIFQTSDSLPSLGVIFGGTRKDFTVDDVVTANGSRVPSVLQSPKVYRQAFILLTRHGQQAAPAQIAHLQTIRDAFVPYFNQQTGGAGYSVTNLQSTPGTTPVQVYFPYFQGNSHRYTGIAVANWGTTPADVQFKAYDNDGTPTSTPAEIINPRMVTIPPGAQIAMLAEQIHGLSLDDPRNGWIQAQSSSGQVTGFFLDGDIGPNFLDGAVAGNQLYKNLYFTQTQLGTTVTPGSDFSNLIDVVNPSATPANLTFTLMGGNSNEAQGKATRTLSANGRLAEDLSSLFTGITKPRTNGYVTVTSDVGLVGYQSVDTGTTVYSLPAQPASTATTLYSAQFASGGAGAVRYFTDINLINTSGQTRNLQVRLVDNNGTPVQVSGIKNPASITLPATQQLRARGENVFNLPDAASATSIVEGSLVITADGPGVVGDVTFGDALAQKFMAALPLDGNPVSTLVFSQVAQGGGEARPYFTGIAMYNPNPTAVSVAIDVYSDQGAKTGSAVYLLGAGARVSRTLPQLVPAITEQVRGYIRLTSSGGPVSAFELFGSQNLDFLTAVPAQPINP